jgi:hypothetical protein
MGDRSARKESSIRKKLFRDIPPREIVESTLKRIGLTGFQDLRWFCSTELRLEEQAEWLPLLEPYYLPCKAKRFFHGRGDLDGPRMITILRHIIEPHGYTLKVEERLYRGKKQSLYQIQPVRSYKDLSGTDMEVRFD